MDQIVTMAVDIAQQAAPAVNSGGINADGWKVITFLCAAIGAMFIWLKLKDKQIADLQAEQVAYLKETIKNLSDDKD